jgi:hypothetical protein
MRAMEARGLTTQALTPDAAAAWRAVAEHAWPQVRRTMVPAETFDRVQTILAEYRSARK